MNTEGYTPAQLRALIEGRPILGLSIEQQSELKFAELEAERLRALCQPINEDRRLIADAAAVVTANRLPTVHRVAEAVRSVDQLAAYSKLCVWMSGSTPRIQIQPRRAPTVELMEPKLLSAGSE